MNKNIYILLFFVFSINIFSQEFVPIENLTLYSFLERMSNLQIITNYNSFQTPMTRKDVSKYLTEINEKKNQLDEVDKKMLIDFNSEFNFETTNNFSNYQSFFDGQTDIFSNNEKYLYYYIEQSKFNIFINLSGSNETVFLNRLNSQSNLPTNSASMVKFGGNLRGSLFNNFYFGIKGTNGKLFGNKEAAKLYNSLKVNFKLNEKVQETYFDESEGYAYLDFDYIKFGISNQKLQIGNGILGTIIDRDAAPFDYLFLNFNYKFLQFDYFHGKLLAQGVSKQDTLTGLVTTIPDKFIGYHRVGFNFSKHFSFGVGEMVIYKDRTFDLSYLNPLNFYKSAEHNNRDRDNSLLFFDFSNNSFKNIKFYATLLIDDIDFSKIGTGWYGNQTLLNVGFNSEPFYGTIPLTLNFQFIHIENYVFTHRLFNNNYTNLGLNLAGDLEPNSNNYCAQISYRFSERLNFSLDYVFTKHGLNKLDSLGNVVYNYGGNIDFGHREIDNTKVKFLDGDIELKHKLGLSITFEPLNQILFTLNSVYFNSTVNKKVISEEIRTFFSLSIII